MVKNGLCCGRGTEFDSAALKTAVHGHGKIGPPVSEGLSSVQNERHRRGTAQDQLFDAGGDIGQLPQMKAVQQIFQRRGKGGMADGGVVSAAAADSEFPGPVLQLSRSQVNAPEIGWMQDILHRCGSGIYVCGFNGGNCNQTTGDFSYGIEGFAFKDGKITHPVREMVITGNMISLWNSLLAAGSDARACTRWQIPTLAFEGVDFSA